MTQMFDLRQRFFVENSPIRGDLVRLSHSYAQVISNKDYPLALQKLLGEMLVASSLLIGTLKIEGYLSIQLQNNRPVSNQPYLKWAMAECDHQGNLRGLADWSGDWSKLQTAKEAFALLGQKNDSVLFIHIKPKTSGNSEGYQGIVEKTADNLADCLTHYQQQSVQIPSVIRLACDGLQAGGILLQLLPNNSLENHPLDEDAFPRFKILTQTLTENELTNLSANEILYRLFHEEKIVIPEPTPLQFACTCSWQKSETAILQLGKSAALNIIETDQTIVLDCGFCGKHYTFDQEQIEKLFN